MNPKKPDRPISKDDDCSEPGTLASSLISFLGFFAAIFGIVGIAYVLASTGGESAVTSLLVASCTAVISGILMIGFSVVCEALWSLGESD
jgi:hypothetical protein